MWCIPYNLNHVGGLMILFLILHLNKGVIIPLLATVLCFLITSCTLKDIKQGVDNIPHCTDVLNKK